MILLRLISVTQTLPLVATTAIRLKFISRMASDSSRMEDQYAIELRDILDINGVCAQEIEGSIISSVVPPLTTYIRRAVVKITKTHPLLVGPGIKTGLDIRIDNPASLGADFVAGCVAALDRYPCPSIIIDMGTATTFAVLDAQKAMVGGCIMPGVRISLEGRSAVERRSCRKSVLKLPAV